MSPDEDKTRDETTAGQLHSEIRSSKPLEYTKLFMSDIFRDFLLSWIVQVDWLFMATYVYMHLGFSSLLL